MSIDLLMRLAPPPTTPRAAEAPGLWAQVEERLRTALPSDYKQLINRYGTGSFYDFLCIVTPFAPDGDLPQQDALSRWADAGRQAYTAMKRSFAETAPEKFPFAAHPEAGGLLAMGGWETGGTLFWLTQGVPDQWGIVAYDEQYFEFQHYPMPIADFLSRWISRTLEPPFFDEGFYERTPPVFRPATRTA